jgi:spermidine synthase
MRPSPEPSDLVPERPALLVLLFLSGAAALVYEVLWLKELGLVFGNTAHAAATTLAVFFLGTAAGAWAFGRRAERLRRPLRGYALLEWGVAGSALLYFALAPAFRWLYAAAYPVVGGHPLATTLLKLLLAVGVLFLPAFFMGGTLPVLGQHLVRRKGELGRTGAALYLVNTAGAAIGALLAGFVLPARLGFRGSYLAAIAASVAVGLAAWVLGGRAAPAGDVVPPRAAGPDPPAGGGAPGAPAVTARAIRVLAFASGFLALSLEVLWTRMFAQVLQNSVYSFAVILVTFLVSLAAGSGVASVLCRAPAMRPSRVLAGLGVVSWVLVTASTPLLVGRTGGLDAVPAGGGFAGYVARIFGLAAVVMLPPGIAVGTVYPYLLKAAERIPRAPGRTLGNLAAINAVGGILGALGSGFVLLPALGLWASVHLVAAGYLAAAGIARGAIAPFGAAATIVVALAGFAAARVALPDLPVVHLATGEGEVLVESWEGRHGIVAVTGVGEARTLRVDNHYALGGTAARESERRQAQIPLFVLPPPESVFFLGMGTGITAGAALDFPVKRVVTCELVPEVVVAARRHFADLAGGLFRDPRSVIVVDDGRHFLTATRERFDVVISDLFVPWHAGTGSLYTRDHFAICRSRLTDGGCFVLWVPACQLSRAGFDVLARTVLDVFPHVTAWRGEFAPGWPTLGLLCRAEATRIDPAQARRNVARVVPDPRPGRVGEAPFLPWMSYAGNLGECRRLFDGAAIDTDDRPVLEYLAPRTQQRADSREVAWLRGGEMLALLRELFAQTPPEQDPFLADASPEQVEYVRAGLQLYEVAVLVDAGRLAEAAPLYRRFLATVPFDAFPGLAAR